MGAVIFSSHVMNDLKYTLPFEHFRVPLFYSLEIGFLNNFFNFRTCLNPKNSSSLRDTSVLNMVGIFIFFKSYSKPSIMRDIY
jgi:hypothetical protein